MARILIIEDDESIVRAYTDVLHKAGHMVDVAGNGQDALRMYSAEYQLILLDMLMPDYDGLDFLRNIKLNERHSGPRVIALSNIDTPRVISAAMDMGVARYLLKVDYTPDQLVDIVADELGRT